jgi:hypothetical protein
MVEAYCSGCTHPALYSRLKLYKAMRGLLWSLWGLIIQYARQPLRRLTPLRTVEARALQS